MSHSKRSSSTPPASEFNKRNFIFACIPGLEQDLKEARGHLKEVDEIEFQDWAKEFTALPEDVLRELWEVKKIRDREKRMNA